jgi:hypothetical protein
LPFTKISWDLSFSKHTSTGLDKNNPLKKNEKQKYTPLLEQFQNQIEK